MAASSQNRLSLFSLSALVIGWMIGAGIISLPITFAKNHWPFDGWALIRREGTR